MPPGRILNLGSGETVTAKVSNPAQTLIDVDQVEPTRNEMETMLVVADAAALPFRKGAFDGVIAKDVLEHLADPIAALRGIREVCHKDARLIVTTPRAIPRAVWADPTHVRGFTRRALVTALELGGWSPIQRPHRIGSLPGADRLRIVGQLERIMRIPGVGHRYGTNWLARAAAGPPADGS
jgi:SAM-dependent methyltransferase